MKHRTRTKAMSWLLSLVLLLGLMPALALPAKAAGDPVARVEWVEIKYSPTPGVQQKHQDYATLSDAVAKLNENISQSFAEPALTLLADVTISDTINVTGGGTRKLNLNGHSITMTDRTKDVIAVTGSGATLEIPHDSTTVPKCYYKVDGTTHRAVIQDSSEGADGSFSGSYITGGNRGIYVQAGKLSLASTTIIGNNVGVYVEGEAKIAGATITGNNTGVHVAGTANIQGSPIIKDNHYDGTTDRNVYVARGKHLTASANLLEGAAIGVTMEDGTGVFTNTASNNTDRNVEGYFFSDNSSYEVRKNNDGQLELAVATAVSYDITKSASVAHGTLEAPTKAPENSSVTVTAAPASGYQLGHLGVYSKKDENKAVSLKALSGYQTNTHEGWAKLVDGNNKTKWGHVFKTNTNPYIIVKASDPLVLKSYTLTTANDTAKYSGRNWKNWTIYGANFATDGEATKDSPEWKPVVTVTNDSTLQAKNYTTYNFTANATTPYQYYKITPTAIRGGNFIQMAELKMTGDVYEKAAVTQDSSDQTKYTFTMPAKDVYVDGYFMEPVATVKRTGGATTFSSTLAGAVADWNAAGNDATLKLLKDVTTAGTIGVSGTKTLDLNGHGIRLTGNNNSVISVGKGANLTLNDSNTNTTHYITLNNWRGTAVDTASAESTVTSGNGVLKVTGGYITGHYGGNNGGINVNAGTLTMNGGTICGNRAATNGGGVMLENNAASRFIMNGGTICHNWASFGAGVYIWTNATFDMKGGTVCKNFVNQHGGGVLEHGKLVMSGGSITENTGGGVARWASGTQPIELSGSAQVTGNSPYNIKLNGAGARKIAVTGALGSDALIGVTMDSNTGVFTNSSDKAKNDVSKFSSDNNNYRVGKNADGQLFLGVPVTVTFDMQGHGTQVGPIQSVAGTTITAPTEPTESGWSFTGWFRDTAFENPWNFTNNVTQNMTLYARWTHLSASVSVAPTAKTLDSEAEDKTLVTAGTAQNGIMRYSLGDNADVVPESWSGEIPSATDAGLYYVWYKAAGQNGYGDSAPACVLVTVSKAIAGVTAPKAQALTYDGTEHILVEAGSTTSGTMQYALGQNAALVPTTGWSTSLPKGTDAGVYYVWYKAAGDGNHEDSEASFVTVTIDKAAPTTTAPNANTLTYTGEAQALTTPGTTSGGVLLYALGTDGVIAPENGWSSDIPKATHAGTYYVWNKVDGNDNYNGTSPVCATVTVGKAAAAELAKEPTAKDNLAYTGQNWELVDAPAGGSALLYALGENGTTAPTDGWSASIPTGMDAGTYYVWYKIAEDENHNEGAPHPVTAVIDRATPTIQTTDLKVTIENIAQINAILSVDAASWSYSSDNGNVTVDADGVVSGVSVGTAVVTITAEPVDSENYNSASVTVNVTVTNKDTQTLTFDENELVENGVVNKTFGDSSFTVEAERIAGDGNISYTSSDATVAAVNDSTGEVTIKQAGTATITAVAAETDGFESTTAFYLLNVSKAVPVVTTVPEAKAGLTYDNTPLVLIDGGTSTTGTTIQYALGDEPVNWSTDIPEASAAGTYTVWYRVVGNENYTDIEANSIPVTIGPAPINRETITVDNIPDQNPTGSQLTPKPTVKHRGTLLVEGADYTLSYGENTAPGDGTVTLTGIGSYTGTRTENFTITNPTYTVTFNAGDGKVSPISAQTDTNGKLSTLPEPTYSGFAFVGWYTEKTDGTQITADYTFTKNTMIYAQYVMHQHDFTYSSSATGTTITATCKNTDGKCTLDDGNGKHTATLTIAAPQHTTYGDGKAATAVITDDNSIQGDAKVKYQKKTGESSYDTKTETAPTDAGTYKASITLGEGEGAKTASVEYTIAKADPTYTAPSNLSATYGQTLKDVSLANHLGWSWMNETTKVGNAGPQTHKAKFTPDDTNNYNTVENVVVTVTVNMADPDTPTGLTATEGQTLANVTLPTGWTWAADSTTSVGNEGENTFKANFAGNSNYNAKQDVDVIVKVSKPAPSGGGSSSGGSTTPVVETITIPISGEDETVNVTVQLKDNTATVTSADVDKVLEAKDVGTVTVDASSLKEDVKEVVLPAALVEKVAAAVANKGNDASGLEIKLPTGTVTFDATTVATLAKQSDGKDLKVHLDNVSQATLTSAQQTTVKDMNALVVLDAYVTADGKRISNFNGGTATFSVPVKLGDGQTAAGVTAYFVAENGEKTEIPCAYDGKNATGTVTHFSNYVVAYDTEKAKKAEESAKQIEDTVKDLDALPAAADVKLEDKEAIEKARAAYDALTDEQKAIVPADTLKKLTDAEAALKAAEPEPTPEPGKVSYDDLTEAEKKQADEIASALSVDKDTAAAMVKAAQELGVSMDTVKLSGTALARMNVDSSDPAGADFGKLTARVTKRTNAALTLKWAKQKKADGYLIYGNKCGKGNKMKLLKTIKKNSTVKWTQKKLKKGTYYKYMVVAYKNVNGQKMPIAASVVLHAPAKGGKLTVAKSVKVTQGKKGKEISKLSVKKGKSVTIRATEVKDEKKLKVKTHRKVKFESSNKKIAKVNAKGKITGKKKGKATVWAYAQNGIFKAVKVTVK